MRCLDTVIQGFLLVLLPQTLDAGGIVKAPTTFILNPIFELCLECSAEPGYFGANNNVPGSELNIFN